MRSMTSALACFATSFVACASTPGAQPHDMSASQHEVMAAHEEQSAAEHAAQYDPKAKALPVRCATDADKRGCWTSFVNPTAEHLKEAERHRKMAADHRAASQALKDAEASACAGISEEDRDMSPFAHREDIARVEELKTSVRAATKGMIPRTSGAVVSFRATPGATAQWLQRTVDCHLARSAALGHTVPEMSYCPLVLKNVSAKVSATSAGFDVALQSDDPETAREILQRAQALVSR
jgi:hypothetical protein